MNATNDGDGKSGRARIAAARRRAERLNLSLGTFCRRAGVTCSTVGRWERGENDPGLGKFADALGRIEAELTKEEARLRGALGAA